MQMQNSTYISTENVAEMDVKHHAMNLNVARRLGAESQLRQTMEECCELAVAANKLIRVYTKVSTLHDRIEARNHLIEEMGDVLILIDQMKFLIGMTTTELTGTMHWKIERTWQRLRKEKGGIDVDQMSEVRKKAD